MSLMDNAGLAIKDPMRAARYLFVKMPIFAQKYVPLDEIFIKQEYKWLYDRIRPDTTLIDIGAYIGDSAIYFCFNNNIKKILAYELVYDNYKEAKANLNRIGLGNRVELVNAGVDSINKKIYADAKHGLDSGANIDNIQKTKHGQHETQIIALEDILKADLSKNVVIKADAEGAEHRMFQNADLSHVYAMQIEYHGGVKDLPKLLEQRGFKVKSDTKIGRLGEGYIYAER